MSATDSRTSGGWYWMPLAVLGLGLGAILMLVGSHWIDSRLMAEDLRLVRAVREIQTDVAVSHLWTEEHVSGDAVDLNEVDRRLAESLSLAAGLDEEGGIDRRRILFAPPDEAEIPSRVGRLRRLLEDFQHQSIERRLGYASGRDVGIGSAMDARYDLVFTTLLEDLETLEASFRDRLAWAEERSDILFRTILMAWVLIVGLAVTGLWTRERRRREAEIALRRSEERLLQAQKMEAVGRLAGGIAHDINNYLAAITTQCELVRMKAGPDGRLVRKMDAVIATAARSSQLIQRLLAFSRRQPVQPRVVDVNEVLRGLERMVRRLVGEDIELVADLAKDLGPVKIDPTQLEQVVLNLVVNSREAMPMGGRLEIRTANVAPSEIGPGVVEGGATGEWVVLSVEDDGPGIPEGMRRKVFEPFFTTKEGGSNSGLGLATVHGIATQSGGGVALESAPRAGTLVKVYLPRVGGVAAALAAPAARPTAVGASRGSGRILLVEDNDVVRRSLAQLLEELGYDTTTAADGGEALARVKRQGTAPDLVITDVVMPTMSGKDLARRLWESDPGLRILFISGHTDDVVLRHGIEEGGVDFLQKPFTAEDLGRKIREVLDR